jgi:subtilisin-like proprotein convertase family protein
VKDPRIVVEDEGNEETIAFPQWKICLVSRSLVVTASVEQSSDRNPVKVALVVGSDAAR